MVQFEVDEQSGIPIWVQLRNRLAYLIDSGYYKQGDRLPTVRALAAEINVNYHTVNKVYTSLSHEGYISSKRGCGAFVSKSDSTGDLSNPGDAIISECLRQCFELGMSVEDVERQFALALEQAKEGQGLK